MMTDNRTRNRALLRFLLLPTMFLTAALLGGLRVQAGTGAVVFVAPPLVALVLAVMLMILFARGRAVEVGRWLSAEQHPVVNVAHALVLVALFFASAQSFNSVLPEAGLLRWMFSFFFLWTLWNNQFAPLDARRLVRSLAALFGTAFVIKHLLLASLDAQGGGLLRRAAGVLLEGVTMGALAGESFAPATGYISFFTLVLYVAGLALLPPVPADEEPAPPAREFVAAYERLSPEARAAVRRRVLAEARAESGRPAVEPKELRGAADSADADEGEADWTLISNEERGGG